MEEREVCYNLYKKCGAMFTQHRFNVFILHTLQPCSGKTGVVLHCDFFWNIIKFIISMGDGIIFYINNSESR